MTNQVVLREGWYFRDIAADIDLDQPGIYEWRIDGVGLYVGKTSRLKSRLRAYPNHVRRMLEGLPWRKSSSRVHRPVHYALRDAHEAQIAVVVRVLEICAPRAANERERYWISLRRQEAAAGGPRVLNVE